MSVRVYAGIEAHVNTVHTCKQELEKSISLLPRTRMTEGALE